MVTTAPEVKVEMWFLLRCGQAKRDGTMCNALLARIEGDQLRQRVELKCRQCRKTTVFD